ncbi:M15 family metallopeptidase [Chitinimonas sp. PSY-7]|uniref:M15 family metallopeptidase n=1 Tax=Chitinimonas sp. PSY-7 TaxID=3459088 RepID=UPI00403FFBC7
MYRSLRKISLGLCSSCVLSNELPPDFGYLKVRAPAIQQDMLYVGNNNFIGRPIRGYEAPKCILTVNAAEALAKVQSQLERQGLGLKVTDCYRPQTAVNDFVDWSEDANNQKMKSKYYPNVDKAKLFDEGYIAKRSGHSRGSTVDVTLVKLPLSHKSLAPELDMGTPIDFMDPLSHPFSSAISEKAQKNRLILREAMLSNGFMPLSTEWWHFTLVDEPYPDTYFDIPVR